MIIVFNWKAYSLTHARIQGLSQYIQRIASLYKNISFLVAPSFVDIERAKKNIGSSVSLCSQDVSSVQEGAYTGEVPASFLRRCGIEYSLIGHSERRKKFGDSDASVARKFAHALSHRITPIVCVGETTRTSSGRAWIVVQKQIQSFIGNANKKDSFMIAYEPVWAIGGGKAVSPAYVAEVAKSIKAYVRTKGYQCNVLYGGSVACNNIQELCSAGIFDGFLIGSAGLVQKEVACIASVTSKCARRHV